MQLIGQGRMAGKGSCGGLAGAAGPWLALLGVLAALAGARGAQASDLAMRGSAIAAERCGKCHGVGVADDSPHRITPPLRDLHKEFPIPMLAEAIKTGTLAGHEEMPQFDLGIEDARALLAYIDSLSPDGRHYLGKRP